MLQLHIQLMGNLNSKQEAHFYNNVFGRISTAVTGWSCLTGNQDLLSMQLHIQVVWQLQQHARACNLGGEAPLVLQGVFTQQTLLLTFTDRNVRS